MDQRSNINPSNNGRDATNTIMNENSNNGYTVIKRNVQNQGGNVIGALRFSIQWNDIGEWDKNDLDIHCIEPTGNEIMYSNKTNHSTGGNLDIDITGPSQGIPACENIIWPDKNRMASGTYRFFVHQYEYRDGHSGFRAEIEFDNKIYSYDYRQTLSNKENVDVANVTLQNGEFSIIHSILCMQTFIQD